MLGRRPDDLPADVQVPDQALVDEHLLDRPGHSQTVRRVLAPADHQVARPERLDRLAPGRRPQGRPGREADVEPEPVGRLGQPAVEAGVHAADRQIIVPRRLDEKQIVVDGKRVRTDP